MLRTVTLHGSLKKFSKTPIQVDANTTQMVMNGLVCQLGQAFKQAIKAGTFHVFKEKKAKGNDMSQEDVPMTLGDTEHLHIYPVVRASGGFFKAIVGIALIAAGVFFGIPILTSLGVSLVLGGIAEMLAPKPKTNKPQEQAGQNPSFIFNGTVNVTEQGGPPPVLYGRVQRASCLVLSAGLTVERLQ